MQNTGTFLEKIMIYYFCVSTNCGPFEGGSGKIANVFNAFLRNTGPVGIFKLLFAVKYLMLNFVKRILASETCSLIH